MSNPVTHPPIAQTVVWRHPCDCDTASRPLNPGEEPEHRFDVDGQPFPWHLEKHRPAWFRKSGRLYLVTVRMFPLALPDLDPLGVEIDVSDGSLTLVHRTGDRVRFPWLLAAKPVSLIASPKDVPILRLTFLAEHVDADVQIPEVA